MFGQSPFGDAPFASEVGPTDLINIFVAPMGVLTSLPFVGRVVAELKAPRPKLTAFAGATAKVSAPSPALSLSGTFTVFGGAALLCPAASLVASGTVSGTASFSPFLRAPMAKMVGYTGAVCSVTTPVGTVIASGTSGSIGGATLTAPLFELTADVTAQSYGSANLLAPAGRLGATAQAWLIAPGATLTAVGSAVVAISYEAYSVNLQPPAEEAPATSHYTNFPFTHIVRYRNSYFGVAVDGLYLLEGTTDDGTEIPYAIKTCTTDFKSPNKKTPVSVYIGARFGPAATVSLFAGEKNPEVYSYSTPRDTRAQNHRQKFGRGIKERYLALGIAGIDVLELDSIEFEISTMTRRL